ncbi:MAG: glycosyltransferase family 1 protein [Patescibacteria group bacterium]
MRVAIDVSSLIFQTGVSQYTQNLVRHLPAELLLQFGFSLRRGDEFPAGVKVIPLPPTAIHYLWNQAHMFPVESFVGPVGIYHSSDWAQGPSRAKKVTTIHDLSPFLFPEETGSKIIAAHTARMKWVVRECDAVICVSQNTAADFQKLFSYPSSKIHVIHEALPVQHSITANTSYVIPDTSYILAIGARQPRKNIMRLIAAYTKYREKYSLPEKLIIVGEKPHDTSYKIHDTVQFTGHISDQQLANYFAGAQAFVYPSLYEGFGLPILEAFHFGVPVAASSTSSIPEVAGSAAILFDPLDEEGIAAGIAQAIKEKTSLVALGKKQLTKFSWKKTADETMEVYKGIC